MPTPPTPFAHSNSPDALRLPYLFNLSKRSQKPRLHFFRAPILRLPDGESRWDWAKRSLTRRDELRALPKVCRTEPSGASWACASGKAAQSQVHGFASTPGPSCFRVGSMFPGVPIHRIAGVFEPNRAFVTPSKSSSACDLGTHKSKECGMGRDRGLRTSSAIWLLPVTQSWLEFHLTQHPFL